MRPRLDENMYELTHIGDGAYMWHDGYQMWIGCEREWGRESVAIDPGSEQNAIDFIRKVQALRRANNPK